MDLGWLRDVPLREVWNHEALGLTPWLLTQADTLMDVLGIDLELSGSEHPVGSFAVDLVGRDQTHRAATTLPASLVDQLDGREAPDSASGPRSG